MEIIGGRHAMQLTVFDGGCACECACVWCCGGHRSHYVIIHTKTCYSGVFIAIAKHRVICGNVKVASTRVFRQPQACMCVLQ